MSGRPQLLFVSPRFLFPVDSGGKIRTTQILKGMLGGAFEITLASPATRTQIDKFRSNIDSICDHFRWWPVPVWQRFRWIARARFAFSKFPIPVAADQSRRGQIAVSRCAANGPDVTVFDFPHSALLGWSDCPAPRAMFAHNVETEIFERHANTSTGWRSLIWRNQQKKMASLEGELVHEAEGVIAVSRRDAHEFERRFDVEAVDVIRTGVDLDFFKYHGPADSARVVFTGAMDWLANIDAIRWYRNEFWSHIARCVPSATMDVVGRNPPQDLVVETMSKIPAWRFTGFVEDVRQYVRNAAVFVIPLRVGGGTRLKAFEAMAMGCPIVSTSIGMEGLDVRDGEHYLRADDPQDFASAVTRLLEDAALRRKIAESARSYVESNCSFMAVAREFEKICLNIRDRR